MGNAHFDSIKISHSSDLRSARVKAKEVAAALGFKNKSCEEIALVVNELGSNLIKYAGSGLIIISSFTDEEKEGIQIESVDHGPGIADAEQAITDGFSTSGSLGYGLGSVNRMMDALDIYSGAGTHGETRILCRRFSDKMQPLTGNSGCVDVGAATRPLPGMPVNGDAFVVKRWDDKILVGVIDGLGHGMFAKKASDKALQFIETHYSLPLKEIFRGVGRNCRGTRGVVMALALIDCRLKSVTVGNVGNIELHLIGEPKPARFLVRRGIIGLNAPNPHLAAADWHDNYLMILHSDGLSTHWRWKQFGEMTGKNAAQIAREMLQSLSKDNDDATVLVVKGRGENA